MMREIPQLMKNGSKMIWNIFDAVSMSKNITQITDPIKFVIISTPRSGSNLLCGMLGAHPQIICFHELFHHEAVYFGPRNRDKYNFGTVEERDRQPYKFLSKIYNQEHGSDAVGFKIFPGHNQKILNFVLNAPEIKKIVLKRENLLFSYTSALIARQTKKWQNAIVTDTKTGREDESKESVKVHVDAKEFFAYIKKNQDYFDYVEKRLIRQKSICINYQELISEDKVIMDLVEFIDVKNDPDLELTKLHTKQNSNKLSNRISNYEELRKKLLDTPYKSFFNG